MALLALCPQCGGEELELEKNMGWALIECLDCKANGQSYKFIRSDLRFKKAEKEVGASGAASPDREGDAPDAAGASITIASAGGIVNTSHLVITD